MAIVTKVGTYDRQLDNYQEYVDGIEDLQSFLHITAPAFDTIMELSADLISTGVLHGVRL